MLVKVLGVLVGVEATTITEVNMDKGLVIYWPAG
jgi:hypothetical protein